jgi:hypoxanthine phosphoribosyltransferase
MQYKYEFFKADCDKIIQDITSNGIKYDYVVGIVRGGAVPAVYISHHLDVPMKTVSWSTFHSDQCKESALDIADDIITDGKKVLLIDDILDSGRTMKELFDDWRVKPEQVDVAVLIYNTAQPIVPKFHGRTIDRNTDPSWVNFWWEVPQKEAQERLPE